MYLCVIGEMICIFTCNLTFCSYDNLQNDSGFAMVVFAAFGAVDYSHVQFKSSVIIEYIWLTFIA